MANTSILTEKELKALKAISHGGSIGASSGLSISERQAIMQSLVQRGYITAELKITPKGRIELGRNN